MQGVCVCVVCSFFWCVCVCSVRGYIYMYICTEHEPEAETSDTHISEEEGRLSAYPSETHHVTTSQDILL
jgi:hypothetical protein